MTRPPVDTIQAPEFLPHLRWLNVKRLRMDRLLGRPVLIEFWDFCRPNSMRTLPYVIGWHERYGLRGAVPGGEGGGPAEGEGGGPPGAGGGDGAGLQVVGVHSPGFPPSREREALAQALERLGVSYPVLVDTELEMWREYENRGWPARYLFDQRGMLFDYHFGEGAYVETELAIQQLLGIEREPVEPVRPEDVPGAIVAPPTGDQPGAYSGPYEAGSVWAVLDGEGTITVNGGPAGGGGELHIAGPGAYPLLEHPRHTEATLELALGSGVTCLQTCFLPGLA